MKYRITLFNKWKKPYFYADYDKLCVSTDIQQYETDDADLCKQMAKDLLDAPVASMTLEEIKQQFSSLAKDGISEEKLVHIQCFYNGRLALCQHVEDFIDTAIALKQTADQRFDIPEEYNQFDIEDNDYVSKQLEAYLEIKVSNS